MSSQRWLITCWLGFHGLLGGCSTRQETDGGSVGTETGGALPTDAGGGAASAGNANSGGLNTGGFVTGGGDSGGGGAGGGGSGGASGGVGSGGQNGSGGASTAPQRCSGGSAEGRAMECLDRGVVAVPDGSSAFVSWRLFGTDPSNVTFTLYRQGPAGGPSTVCSRGPDAGTWCRDDAPVAGASYFVRATIDGTEGAESGSAVLQAQDYIRIPLEPAAEGAFVHLAWVGDLDGDGEYDFVVNRISAAAPVIDGYSRHGEFLWRLDTGPLGVNQDNIEGGATTMSNGMWDGLTVFDLDSDGFAEVAVKTAQGFVFGNGDALDHDNAQDQFVSIVDGQMGEEITRAPLPSDFSTDGPLQCQFGVGYFDGAHPSVVAKCKNRVGSEGFNLVVVVYDFDGTELTQRFKRLRSGNEPDYHQIRVMDVDGDGRDEILDGGYVIDDDGSQLYSLGDQGIIHGDRFFVTDIDPARPGLEGFGIQQDNANGLETYYYDAATGVVLREHRVASGPGGDLARGTVADLFATEPGLEYWSFNGLFSGPAGGLLVAEVDRNVPWPNFAMQWDGDFGTELLDNNRVGDWNLEAQERNTYVWRRTFEGAYQARGAIPLYGDILGDWRDEALLENGGELRIYTTTYETDHRLYTMVHNPAYRNSLTVHGYKQSHHVDYFLGFEMEPPLPPSIRLVQPR